MRRASKQITLDFRKSRRGGVRKGAGRKRKNPKARPNVPHRKRVRFGSPRALQVTVRLCKGLLSMRRRKLHTLLLKRLWRDLHGPLDINAIPKRSRLGSR